MFFQKGGWTTLWTLLEYGAVACKRKERLHDIDIVAGKCTAGENTMSRLANICSILHIPAIACLAAQRREDW